MSKAFLANRSARFRAEFQSHPTAKRVRIGGVSPEVVEAFLKFFYTEQISESVDLIQLYRLLVMYKVSIQSVSAS